LRQRQDGDTPRCRRYRAARELDDEELLLGIAARSVQASMTRTRVPRTSTSSRIESTILRRHLGRIDLLDAQPADAIQLAARIPALPRAAVRVWMLSSKA